MSEQKTKQVKELRIGVLGSVDSGKSTLTGVLTTGTLDDGRGLVRSKVLKHPHEQETGRTSDVSQRFIREKTNDGKNEKVIGTGLGLSIVSEATKSLKGNLKVSKLKGNVFCAILYLPLS